jgi:hypothetical protein
MRAQCILGNFAGLAGFMLWPNDDKTVLRSFWVKMAPKGIAIVMGPLALTVKTAVV